MINLYDILEAADGQLFGDPGAAIFTDFCFDSRRAGQGQLFVAVRTERGDGHQFIGDAVRGGATGVMCNKPPEFDTTGITVIVMRDVEAALLNWTKLILRKFGTTVIGVTGGSGKSTSKELIAAVLGTKHSVYRSPGSFNGKFGLPLSLGKLTAEHKLAVLEYGIDHYGEMADLCAAAPPTVGVVTNVSNTYLDRFGNTENIAAEHRILAENLPRNGLCVLNYDDELVYGMASHTKSKVLTIGIDRGGSSFGADFMAYNLVISRDKTGFDLRHERERYVGQWTPLLGAHQLVSVMAALAVGFAFGVSVADGLRALKEVEPLPGRMKPLPGKNGALLIDDTFNATPESTLAALEWMQSVQGRVRVPKTGALVAPSQNGSPQNVSTESKRSIFVLGDLDSLGTMIAPAHRELGEAAKSVADVLITQGELAAISGRAAVEAGMSRAQVKMTFSAQDAARVLGEALHEDDVVLIKGGAGARMEQVTRLLLEHETDVDQLPRTETAYDSVWVNRPNRPTWIEVDKTAIGHNVRQIRSLIGADVALMAIVKANAFGHGALAVSSTALLNGADYLGVASVSEAVDLREDGIDAPILCLGYTPPWAIRQAIQYGLTVTVYDLDLARTFDRIAREMKSTLKIHIKVDSGMSRLGFAPDQVVPSFRAFRALDRLEVEGIYTHFSSADTDLRYTQGQLQTFMDQVKVLAASGYKFKYTHAANTAAALTFPDSRLNMVRIGIGLYGLDPNPDAPLDLPDLDLRPAMAWKTTIAQVREVPNGGYVGYGNTYRAQGARLIAVIPVGYADGFRRAPTHWSEVLVHGSRVPLVGRVSMDMATIDVTDVPTCVAGDEVVLIGKQGKDQITAAEVARTLDTNVYEVVSTIMARVPRL